VDLADQFGAFLIDENIITSQVLDRARRAARSTGERFDRVLTKLGLISEAELASALSRYLSVPLATAADVPAEQVMPEMIRPDFVRRNRVMPLAINAGSLSVGVTDPFNDEPLRALTYLTNLTVAACIFVPADFDKAYEALYVDPAAESNPGASSGIDANEIDVQRLRDMASEAPTIRLVNQIIFSAVEVRASDILAGLSLLGVSLLLFSGSSTEAESNALLDSQRNNAGVVAEFRQRRPRLEGPRRR
jgi:general secretion pathway protein E